MLRSLCLALVALVASAGAVSAQNAEAAFEPSGASSLSASTAFAYSAAATVVPAAVGTGLLVGVDSRDAGAIGVGLIGLAVLFGPSVGSAMLGDGRRVRHGVLLRTVGAGLVAGGLAYSIQAGLGGSPTARAGDALAVAGLGLATYGVAYSALTLHDSARLQTGVGPSGVSVRVQL